MRILINAAGSAAAPTIIKHIKSLGHSVVGIDASVESKKYAMTYCDEYFISPIAADPDFIKFIASIGKKFDLYLPYIDEELIALSKCKDMLPELKKKIVLNDKLLNKKLKIKQKVCKIKVLF